MRERVGTLRSLVGGATRPWWVAAVLGASAACGGAPKARPVTDDAPEPRPNCISDEWEKPPPDLGQNPPDRDAPEEALRDFLPAGSGDGPER